ncbi:hypothetical protein LTS18_009497, partial [Coniosporium uncinatum]
MSDRDRARLFLAIRNHALSSDASKAGSDAGFRVPDMPKSEADLKSLNLLAESVLMARFPYCVADEQRKQARAYITGLSAKDMYEELKALREESIGAESETHGEESRVPENDPGSSQVKETRAGQISSSNSSQELAFHKAKYIVIMARVMEGVDPALLDDGRVKSYMEHISMDGDSLGAFLRELKSILARPYKGTLFEAIRRQLANEDIDLQDRVRLLLAIKEQSRVSKYSDREKYSTPTSGQHKTEGFQQALRIYMDGVLQMRFPQSHPKQQEMRQSISALSGYEAARKIDALEEQVRKIEQKHKKGRLGGFKSLALGDNDGEEQSVSRPSVSQP